MKIRADIAALLRAGVPQSHITRQLHCAPLTVQRTREALKLPAPRTCRVLPTTLEAAFDQHARPNGNGHVEWLGYFNGTAPYLTFQKTVHSAYRVAFRFHYEREPIGRVTSSCDVKSCVAGRCLEDQPMRQKSRATYASIFGGTA